MSVNFDCFEFLNPKNFQRILCMPSGVLAYLLIFAKHLYLTWRQVTTELSVCRVGSGRVGPEKGGPWTNLGYDFVLRIHYTGITGNLTSSLAVRINCLHIALLYKCQPKMFTPGSESMNPSLHLYSSGVTRVKGQPGQPGQLTNSINVT